MGIWKKLLETEWNIRKRLARAFGRRDPLRTPAEVRREILEQVESKIASEALGKDFPYARVVVELRPPTQLLRDIFETAFLRADSLRNGIAEKLQNVRHPGAFEIIVRLEQHPEAPSPGPLFALDFVKPDPPPQPEIPETRITISKGSAERPAYRMRRDRILIGRLSEIQDREGRMVRKNDVVFLDNGDDINSTVDHAHARVWFDTETQEFRIMDEVSRFGTRIVREGRSIEVPGGNPNGIPLRSGDAIFFGQACMRFESPSSTDGAPKAAPGSPPAFQF